METTPLPYHVKFWLLDTPTLSGEVRAFFYTSLLLSALASPWSRPPHGDSPLHAPELIENTLPQLIQYQGWAAPIARLFGWRTHGSAAKRPPLPLLRGLRAITFLAWVCCAVGLGGAAPPVITALGFTALSAFSSAVIGISHRWLIPLYALLALSLANGNGSFSVDAYLGPRGNPVVASPPHPLLLTGLGTKLAMIAAVYSLVAGAYSKIANAGLSWGDGASLGFYMKGPLGTSPAVKRLLGGSGGVLRLLAAGGLVFELASAAVPFGLGEGPRLIWVANCLLFHLSIWLTMRPNYLPQALVYSLVVALPWGLSGPRLDVLPEGLGRGAAEAAAGAATAAAAAMAAAMLLRYEQWPLSSIPMYSFYRSGFSRDQLQTAAEVEQVVAEARATRYPYALGWSEHWAALTLHAAPARARFAAAEGSAPAAAPRDLAAALAACGAAQEHQIKRLVCYAALQELVYRSGRGTLAALLAGAAAPAPPPPPAAGGAEGPSPAQAFLAGRVAAALDEPSAQRARLEEALLAGGAGLSLQAGCSVQLSLRFAGRELKLAEVVLNPRAAPAGAAKKAD